MSANRDVDTSPDEEIKGIAVRRLAGNGTPNRTAVLVQIPIKIAVCSAEHGLHERFEMGSAELYDWSFVISEQIPLDRKGARSATRAVRCVGDGKGVRVASVALQLSLDSDVLTGK
jgi:hypothetical protein